MARIRAEDRQFALRLGNVLKELRAVSPWRASQETAAEKMGFNPGTYGRWERGDYAPKGYDLGRLYRGYQPYGARMEWFLDPPEVVIVNPVRERLAELADAGIDEGLTGGAEEEEQPPRDDGGPGAMRVRRSA